MDRCIHEWVIFLFRVIVKPNLLKKDNLRKQETVKKIGRERRTRLFLVNVAEVRLMMDWAPGRHPSLLIPGSAGGNEPHMHKLVRGRIVIPVPFAISSSAKPLMQIEQDVTVTSGAK